MSTLHIIIRINNCKYFCPCIIKKLLKKFICNMKMNELNCFALIVQYKSLKFIVVSFISKLLLYEINYTILEYIH